MYNNIYSSVEENDHLFEGFPIHENLTNCQYINSNFKNQKQIFFSPKFFDYSTKKHELSVILSHKIIVLEIILSGEATSQSGRHIPPQ